jgi:hypothetical protein
VGSEKKLNCLGCKRDLVFVPFTILVISGENGKETFLER